MDAGRVAGVDAGAIAPDAACVERFRGDVARLIGRAFDGDTRPPDARLALAVSGGPDSMAMLALAVAAFPGRVHAATFDHGLREASADEARMVASACAARGVPHEILGPAARITGGSIQAQARAARYAALTEWAASCDAVALLTAHHADDQAETLLMRLNRASGIAGLAAIRPWRFAGDLLVLRPLLGWRRAALRAIVERARLPFVDDPSNADPHYDRTRIRALLADHPELDPAALAASAAYLADAEDVLYHAALTLWTARWHGPDRPLCIHDLPRELQRRLLRRAVIEARRLSGIVLPRFGDASNIEAIVDALEAGRGATIGGVMIVRRDAGWTFRAAPPRRSH